MLTVHGFSIAMLGCSVAKSIKLGERLVGMAYFSSGLSLSDDI